MAGKETRASILVREYLVFAGFLATVETFDGECVKKNQTLTESQIEATEVIKNAKRNAKSQQAMVEAFTKGDRKQFFALWSKTLPKAVLAKDMTKKLEFYCNLFFSVFPIHPWNKKLQPSDRAAQTAAMNEFKTYLATKGAELCKTTEFVSYYALPYVPNPTDHPSFRELFLAEWASSLRERLDRFLCAALKTTALPKLLTLGESSSIVELPPEPAAPAVPSVSVTVLKAQEQELRTLKQRYSDLLAVARSLCDALNRSMSGQVLPHDYLPGVLYRLSSLESSGISAHTPALPPLSLSPQPPERSPSVPPYAPAPLPDDPRWAQAHQYHEPERLDLRPSAPPAALNYEAIKADLLREGVAPNTKCLLLQALRWRLTRTRPAAVRKRVLHSFIQNDMLEVLQKARRKQMLAYLFNGDVSVREFSSSLVNTIASESAGRTYLLDTDSVLDMLVDVLLREHDDTPVRRHVLGALQKFSLRRHAQTRMIRLGLIPWLAGVLRDAESHNLSEYSVEYGTALLMNLSLRTEGKRACADPALDILRVLSDLLENENMQVRTYVNGTLFSVLSRANVKERAKAMGMRDILQRLKQYSDPNLGKQLNFIIDQLDKDEVDDEDAAASEDGADQDDDVDDEENDDDYLADDDPADETLPGGGGPSGEELLCTYLVDSAAATAEERRVSERMQQDQERHVPRTPRDADDLTRPRTPHHVTPPPSIGRDRGADRSIGRKERSKEDLGSKPSPSSSPSKKSPAAPPADEYDMKASAALSGIIGDKKLHAPTQRPPTPTEEALKDVENVDQAREEYSAAFASRSRVARTPNTKKRAHSQQPPSYDPDHEY